MKQKKHIVVSVLLVFLPAVFTVQVYAGPVQAPQLLKQLKWTGTSWFGSPIIHNLGDGPPKLIGTYYSIYVWDNQFNLLDTAPSGSDYPHEGRIYAPAVCADLDADGI